MEAIGVQVHPIPQTPCVSLDKCLGISVAQCPRCKSGDNDIYLLHRGVEDKCINVCDMLGFYGDGCHVNT